MNSTNVIEINRMTMINIIHNRGKSNYLIDIKPIGNSYIIVKLKKTSNMIYVDSPSCAKADCIYITRQMITQLTNLMFQQLSTSISLFSWKKIALSGHPNSKPDYAYLIKLWLSTKSNFQLMIFCNFKMKN